MKYSILLIVLVIALFMLPMVSSAASGTSEITLSTTSISIPRGGSSTVTYNVKLASGNTWGTSISASAPSGISVTFSNPTGDPPFSGTATVTVAKTVSPGTYTIEISATGDDPSSSPATLSVTVMNTTVTTAPPPAPVVHVNYIPFIVGGIAIALFVVFLIIFSLFLPAYSKPIRYVTYTVTLILSMYLITYDHVLLKYAYSHWLGLIVYLLLSTIFFGLTFSSSQALKRSSLYLLTVGNILLGLLMIVDTVFGLPYSSLHNVTTNVGWDYLFGYGTTSISTVGISLAFTLLFIFVGIYAGVSLREARVLKG
ncbi:COG1470 family protein [Thermoplasma volcanium]|nr:hypothetical protein [Thermoplasma volcanium]